MTVVRLLEPYGFMQRNTNVDVSPLTAAQLLRELKADTNTSLGQSYSEPVIERHQTPVSLTMRGGVDSLTADLRTLVPDSSPIGRAASEFAKGTGQKRIDGTGDSYGVGAGATVPTTGGYMYRLAAAFPDFVFTNSAISGREIQRFATATYNLGGTDRTIVPIVAGANNWLYYMPDANYFTDAEAEYFAQFATNALSPSRFITAAIRGTNTINDGVITYTGSWANAAGGGPGTCAIFGTSVGAKAVFPALPADADTMLVFTWRASGGNGGGTVNVNGVQVGAVALGGVLTNRNAPGNGNNFFWSLYCSVIPVTPGANNVPDITVTTTGGGGVCIHGIAGINRSGGNGGPAVLIAPHPYLLDSAFNAIYGHATPGGAVAPDTFWYQAASYERYVAPIRRAIANCAALGMNVIEIDLAPIWIPNLHISGDNIHPGDEGHRAIADQFIKATKQIVGQ